MKQIETFIDSAYRNVTGDKKEIQELKAEMKSHLLDAVNDLKAEGKSEQDAIEIAIKRFGGDKEMRSIVSQLFKAQKTFAKWVLYLAVTFLLMSIVTVVIHRQNAESESNQISEVATKIDRLLGKETSITPKMETKIENWIKDTDFITQVKIYNVKELKKNADYNDYDRGIFDYVEQKQIKPDYQYKRTVWAPVWLYPEFFPYGNGDDEWLVTMKKRYFNIPLLTVLIAGVTAYWTLFSIWAIINAYHHKRLNVVWIFIFVLLNFVGYLVYPLSGKKILSKKISPIS